VETSDRGDDPRERRIGLDEIEVVGPDDLTLDVVKNLAALLVETVRARSAAIPLLGKMGQDGVNGRRPWARRPPTVSPSRTTRSFVFPPKSGCSTPTTIRLPNPTRRRSPAQRSPMAPNGVLERAMVAACLRSRLSGQPSARRKCDTAKRRRVFASDTVLPVAPTTNRPIATARTRKRFPPSIFISVWANRTAAAFVFIIA
jgi:hypothetical protein